MLKIRHATPGNLHGRMNDIVSYRAVYHKGNARIYPDTHHRYNSGMSDGALWRSKPEKYWKIDGRALLRACCSVCSV